MIPWRLTRLPPIVSGAAIIYALQGLALLAGIALSVVLARALGPEGKGTVDLFLLLTTLLPELMGFGIAGGTLFQLANRHRPLGEVHATALLLAGAWTIAGLVLAVFAGPSVARLVGDLPPELASVALAIAGLLVYMSVWPSIMTGINRAPYAYALLGVSVGINVSLVIVLALLGKLTVANAVAASVATWIVTVAIQFFVTLQSQAGPIQASTTSARDCLAYGIRVYPGALANRAHYRIDQLVISQLLGAGSVGIYSISVRWAETLWRFGYGMSVAGLFRIADTQRRDAFDFAVRLSASVTLISAASAAALAVAGKLLLVPLYGADFQDALTPLVLLLPGVVLWDGARVLSQFISYNVGRPEIPMAISIVAAIGNLLLTIVVVPIHGIAGAAAASSVTYTAAALATLWVFWKVGRGTKADAA